MATWNFDSTIPATNNNPSQDQPKMLQNNVSTEGILDEDHYTFESTVNGNSVDGQHKNLRLPTQNVIVPPITNPASAVYTDAGSASTNSDLRFINESGVFPLSAIRACGAFTTIAAAGPVSIDNGHNIVSITRGVGAVYTIVLTSNCVTGNDVIVVTGESNTNNEPTYSFTNPNLIITLNTNSTGSKISFVVIQI